jgi:flagellar L-ring protein precursor FlgH
MSAEVEAVGGWRAARASAPASGSRARGLALVLAPALLVLLGGCGLGGATVEPRALPEMPSLTPSAPGPGASGSLWRADHAANYPFLDVRPRFPGDLLTVVISEETEGEKDADTALESSSSISASVQEFFGIPTVGSIDPSNVVTAESARSFDGSGETSRSASLSGRITVTVTAVEPNGNLQVAGQKTVTLNSEEEYVVLRGVVRPEDIDGNNEVASWRLADARIDFFGSGVVANQQRPGLGYTLLDWLWPF